MTSDGTAESGFSHGGRWRHCWDADRVGSGEKILCQCRLVATLNSLTYNVLWVMKRKALPPSWWSVRLKALRFHLLCIAARVIEHGRRLFLKIAKYHPHFLLYKEAREKLFIFSSA